MALPWSYQPIKALYNTGQHSAHMKSKADMTDTTRAP